MDWIDPCNIYVKGREREKLAASSSSESNGCFFFYFRGKRNEQHLEEFKAAALWLQLRYTSIHLLLQSNGSNGPFYECSMAQLLITTSSSPSSSFYSLENSAHLPSLRLVFFLLWSVLWIQKIRVSQKNHLAPLWCARKDRQTVLLPFFFLHPFLFIHSFIRQESNTRHP